jgi:hypothetical protein
MASSHKELLTGHPVARAADVDEAHDAVTRLYLPHRLEVLERDTALNMTLNAVRMGAVTVGYFRYGGAVRMVTADASNYHINVPVAGQCEQQCGSFDPVLASTNRTAAVFMPGYPADLRWQADSAQLCLMIDRHDLEFELERQIGQPLAKPLQFSTAMDLSTPAAQSWLAVLELLEREIDRPGGIAQHPLASAHLQMLVIAGLLLAQPHNYSVSRPRSRSRGQRTGAAGGVPAFVRGAADGLPAGGSPQPGARRVVVGGPGRRHGQRGRRPLGLPAPRPVRGGLPA